MGCCKYSIAVKVLLFFACLQVTVMEVSAESEKCRGAFDVYFVLDRSSSLLKQRTNHFRSDAVPFVETLSKMFVSPLLRMSYITFADSANVVMPLTSDRQLIESKLDVLKRIVPDGPTLMDLGIEKATRQISSSGDRRASVIIVLTDGRLEYRTKLHSVKEADKARALGSTVFMVGVSSYDEQQLLDIAGGLSKYVFKATDFGKLSVIADQILDSSCVEILSANPTSVCVNDSFNVRIYGRGFNRNGDISRTMCNFQTNDNEILIKPKEATDEFLLCESPDSFVFQDEKKISVQVTLNEGLSFISSNVTITAYKCTFQFAYVWLALAFLFLPALAMLWWMWNFLTCKKKPRREQPRPSRPPPPPAKETPQPKHWPAVDASYYGGAGAGGIKPVPVRWGDLGSTEAAAHLERTKDAKEIAVDANVESETNANRPSAKSETPCMKLAGIFYPIVQFYSWVASKRPTSEEVKSCICLRKT